MKIYIMHFASSLLRSFSANIFFQELLYEVLRVLSRCCFHHLVDNLILYKKDTKHFYIGPILFHKIKSYSWQKSRVKNNLVPRVRNGKNYLVPGDKVYKNYLVPGDKVYKNYLVPNESYEKINWQSEV